jgi:hypothetical protein
VFFGFLQNLRPGAQFPEQHYCAGKWLRVITSLYFDTDINIMRVTSFFSVLEHGVIMRFLRCMTVNGWTLRIRLETGVFYVQLAPYQDTPDPRVLWWRGAAYLSS